MRSDTFISHIFIFTELKLLTQFCVYETQFAMLLFEI